MNQRIYDIVEASQIGEVRRRALALAAEAGMDEAARNDAAIVVTELATNLVNHAKAGALLLRAAEDAQPGIEAIAIDRGPGIPDLHKALQDGYSTRGTAGNGIGAVKRLSSQFDIWTAPSGTAVLARVGLFSPTTPLRIGSVCLPLKGEQLCGDAWSVHSLDEGFALLVVDGLGHGDGAAAAAQNAVAAFRESDQGDPHDLLEEANARMRGSRGGAVAIAALSLQDRTVRYCAVGNIAGRLDAGEAVRGLVSHNGIVGGQYRRSETFTYEWPADALLIMHSDGVQTRWDLRKYPGLRLRHPALIAAVLYRDFARGHDDATVVVVSCLQPNAS